LNNGSKVSPARYRQVLNQFLVLSLVGIIPILLAMSVMNLWHWDLSIPLVYLEKNGDETWQFMLTKTLIDTGWILNNPFLGAPDVAHLYNNAAAQTSALHSILMLGLAKLLHDPIKVQQVYYLLNFGLISLTSFFSCRLLGMARLPAFCIGILFSLLGYRFNFVIYAFLANYFAVPLALVPVFWIMTGEFSKFFSSHAKARKIALKEVLSSSKFFLGLSFIVLIAISDGYYAFFTLLLLGFATIVRALSGDIKKPASLLVPAIYIATLITVALVLAWPLHAYKHSHPEEFAPNGVQDPALIKHSFEAEVYSSSLKLLIAPPPNHRVESLAHLGQKMINTSEAARQFKIGAPYVSLGILGSILFATALTLLTVPALHRVADSNTPHEDPIPEYKLIWAAIALAFFIFLCSISGGIGTLIALVYPGIRAYDRFPLFLLFVLYVGAGTAVTVALKRARNRKRWILVSLIALITILSLYDQIPSDAAKVSAEVRNRFLAEKNFVKTIEKKLPSGAMVYQYPYSQYLRDSKYYGWGSFAGVRLYLHSHNLRWSNGGAKNSPADDWNFRISQLPLNKLIAEVEAVGFSGFALDRTVVKSDEYQHMRRTFTSMGYEVLEDVPSKLAFVRLRDPGFKLVYDPTYREADHIVVTNPAHLLAQSDFPELIDGTALRRFVSHDAHKINYVIRKADHPEIFVDGSTITRGLGQTAITPITDMRGKMSCKLKAGSDTDNAPNTLLLTIENQSRFNWKLGDGPFPIRIGAHIRQPDGKLLSWDNGFRVPTDAYIQRGASQTIRMPINILPLGSEIKPNGPLVAEFALVQDGNAWFGNISCTVPLR